MVPLRRAARTPPWAPPRICRPVGFCAAGPSRAIARVACPRGGSRDGCGSGHRALRWSPLSVYTDVSAAFRGAPSASARARRFPAAPLGATQAHPLPLQPRQLQGALLLQGLLVRLPLSAGLARRRASSFAVRCVLPCSTQRPLSRSAIVSECSVSPKRLVRYEVCASPSRRNAPMGALVAGCPQATCSLAGSVRRCLVMRCRHHAPRRARGPCAPPPPHRGHHRPCRFGAYRPRMCPPLRARLPPARAQR